MYRVIFFGARYDLKMVDVGRSKDSQEDPRSVCSVYSGGHVCRMMYWILQQKDKRPGATVT